MVAWRDLRSRRAIGWTTLVLSTLLFLLPAVVWFHIHAAPPIWCGDGRCVWDEVPEITAVPPWPREEDLAFWALWLPVLLWGAASLYRWSFRCPHCGRRYAVRPRRCGHCGIGVGTPWSGVVPVERGPGDFQKPTSARPRALGAIGTAASRPRSAERDTDAPTQAERSGSGARFSFLRRRSVPPKPGASALWVSRTRACSETRSRKNEKWVPGPERGPPAV
jgi:hypothetical protein